MNACTAWQEILRVRPRLPGKLSFCNGCREKWYVRPACSRMVICRRRKRFRSYLRDGGDHVEALRLLAKIEHQRGSLSEAERLLSTVVRRAPDLRTARMDLPRVLIDSQKYSPAREVIDVLLQHEPGNRDYLSMHAATCAGLGQHDKAITVYRQMLILWPESWDLHIAL